VAPVQISLARMVAPVRGANQPTLSRNVFTLKTRTRALKAIRIGAHLILQTAGVPLYRHTKIKRKNFLKFVYILPFSFDNGILIHLIIRMPLKLFVFTAIESAIFFFILFVSLFCDALIKFSATILPVAFVKTFSIFRDNDTQKSFVIYFCCLFLLLLGARMYFKSRFIWQAQGGASAGVIAFLMLKSNMHFAPDLWLAFSLFFSCASYFISFNYSTDLLVLLYGVVLAQSLLLWPHFSREMQNIQDCCKYIVLVVFAFLILFLLASVCDIYYGHAFFYHGSRRLTGPWESPNVYGIMMAVGTIISFGTIVLVARRQFYNHQSDCILFCSLGFAKMVLLIFISFSFVWMVSCLVKSYSRGALFGAFSGIMFLIFKYNKNAHFLPGFHFGNHKNNCRTRFAMAKNYATKNSKKLSVIICICSIVCILFWQLQLTNILPVQRLLSTVNNNDTSWKNRIAACIGSFEITAEHPWFGTGWSQPELLYQHYYISPQLTESAAIELNDYMIVSSTLGIPALLCFILYLWQALTGTHAFEFRNRNLKMGIEILRLDWMQTTCQAGAIVLLVGFWFDGGLFKLPTAATFWILLELGAVDPQNYFTTKNAEIKEIKLTH